MQKELKNNRTSHFNFNINDKINKVLNPKLSNEKINNLDNLRQKNKKAKLTNFRSNIKENDSGHKIKNIHWNQNNC